MVWTLFTPQQQRGAQLHNRSEAGAQPGEAGKDRAAQDHEQAGATPQPGEAPASSIENRTDTPDARAADAEWDRVVQPQRQAQQGATELEQDERGEDAEQMPDPQAEQALTSMQEDDDEPGESAPGDRND
jgi:hypothetical protein